MNIMGTLLKCVLNEVQSAAPSKFATDPLKIPLFGRSRYTRMSYRKSVYAIIIPTRLCWAGESGKIAINAKNLC